MTQGLDPYSILSSFFLIFLAVIHFFVTAYLSKSLNLNEKSSKMIKIQYTDPKPGWALTIIPRQYIFISIISLPAPEPLAGHPGPLAGP